jgi:hypothetical protein
VQEQSALPDPDDCSDALLICNNSDLGGTAKGSIGVTLNLLRTTHLGRDLFLRGPAQREVLGRSLTPFTLHLRPRVLDGIDWDWSSDIPLATPPLP